MSGFLMRDRGPVMAPEGEGGGGAPVTGGEQGAVTSEQIAEIVKTVTERILPSIDGAITSRFGTRDQLRDLQELPATVKALAAKLTPAEPTNGKPASDGTGKPTMTAQLEENRALLEENKALKLNAHRGALNTELRTALSAAGVSGKVSQGATVSPLDDAVKGLMSQADQFGSETDIYGNTTWSGKVKNEIGGIVPGTLQESVNQFVAARTHYQPPIGSDGSGAGGGGRLGAGNGVLGKSLDDLTPEDISKMSPEDFDKTWTRHGGAGESSKQDGFFSQNS